MSEAADRRRWIYILPLIVFLAVGVALAVGLTRDASTLPSALLDKPAPAFELPGIEGRDVDGLTTEDLKQGGPKLVNVFASWCVPCRVEHPILMRLSKEGYVVHGINQRDEPKKAMAFLSELGDPYQRIGSDRTGRVSIEWGVYGVPETFILDGSGRIVYKHVGPIQARDLESTIYPILKAIQ